MKKNIHVLSLLAGFSVLLSLFVMGIVNKYDPLLVQTINLGSSVEYNLEYENEYDGNHAIVLASALPVSIGEDYDTDGLEVNLSLVSLSGKKLSKSIQGHLYPFWGDQYRGVGLIRYVVPVDLPKKEPVTINISFDGKSHEVLKKYQFTKLIVLKLSDE